MQEEQDYSPESSGLFYRDSKLNDYLLQQLEKINPHDIVIDKKHVLAKFYIPSQGEGYSILVEGKQIECLFVIGRSFPIEPPWLHIIEALTVPKFSDLRDLTADVLDEKWSYKIGLRGIRDRIGSYLGKKVPKDDKPVFYYSEIGFFHLNSYYSMRSVKILHPGEWFIGTQKTESKQKIILKTFIFVILHTHVLIFLPAQQPVFNPKTQKYDIPNEDQIQTCKLVFYGESGTLLQILGCKKDKFTNLTITFKAKKTFNMQVTDKTFQWKLAFKNGRALLQKLFKSVKNYEPLDTVIELCPDEITEDEAAILLEITKKQKQIRNKFNKDTIRELNIAYQKIVEYYSMNNIPYEEIYLQKIAKLNMRPDVQLIMQADSPLVDYKGQKQKMIPFDEDYDDIQ